MAEETDLGTARGHIKIDADVDTDAAAERLTAIRERMSRLGDNAGQIQSRLQGIEDRLSSMGQKAQSAGQRVSDVSSRLGDLAKQGIYAGTSMAGLGDNFDEVALSALRMVRSMQAMRGQLNDLRSPAALAGTALTRIFGINKEMERMPGWSQRIVRFSSTLAAAGAASTIAAAGFNRFAPSILRTATSAVLARDNVAKFSRGITESFGSLRGIASRLSGAVISFAMFRSGLRDIGGALNLLKGIATKAFLPLIAGIGALAALKFAPAVVGGIANVVASLQTLIGTIAILPGAIAVLGTIGLTAKLAMSSLGEAFKAGFGEASKFSKATANMSDEMKGFARGLQEVKKRYADFTDDLAMTSFGPLIRNFRQMALDYAPMLERGMGAVAAGISQATKSVMEFATQARTVQALNSIFNYSAVTASNFGMALGPILEGLREIAVVGAQSFAELSGGAMNASLVFRRWATDRSADGTMKAWADKGIQGIRDLHNAFTDFFAGVNAMIGQFGGAAGNPLARLAESAEEFKKKARGDWGAEMGQGFQKLQAIGDNTFAKLKAVFDALVSVIESMAPALIAFSDSFTSKFISSLDMVTGVVSAVAEVFNVFDGVILRVLGNVLAGVAVFKLMALAIRPIITLMKVFAGAATITFFSSAMMALDGSLKKMAASATVATGRLSMLQGAIGKARTAALTLAMIGPGAMVGIFAAITALTMLYSSYKSGEEANKKIEDSYKAAAEAAREFGKEVRDNAGIVNDKAMQKALESAKNTRQAIEDTRKEQGTFGEFAADFAQDTFSIFGLADDGASNTTLDKKKASISAGEQQEVMRKFTIDSDEDLAKLAISSQATFDSVIARMRATGEAGAALADKIATLRDGMMKYKDATDRIGEGNMNIANGIRALADEASSALDKLNALEQVMRGLGLIATSKETSLADYTTKVKDIGDEAVKTAGTTRGQSLLAGGEGGRANSRDVAGATLTQEMEKLRKLYYEAAIAGKDAGTTYDQIRPQVERLAQAYGFQGKEMEALIRNYGFIPDQIQTAISVIGADATQAEIAAFILQLRQIPAGKTISLSLQDEQAKQKIEAVLNQFGGKIEAWNAETKELKIKIPENVSEQVRAQLVRQLQEQGLKIEVPATVAPGTNAPPAKVVPVAPGQNPNATPPPAAPGAPQTPQQQVNGVQQAAGQIKPQYETTIIVKGSEDSVTVIQRVIDKLKEMASTKATIDVQVTSNAGINLPKFIEQLAQIGQASKISIDTSGLDQFAGKLEETKNKVNEVVEQIKPKVMEISAKFTEMANAVNGILDTMVSSAKYRGEKLASDFAAGIESGKTRVQNAATAIATAATNPLPKSPAKTGPLSGKGYTDARGKKLSEDFARGITAGQGSVENASLKLGGAAVPQSDIAVAVQAILSGGGANMEALRKYGLGPTSDETNALADAGKKGVTAFELEQFLKSGDFQASGLAGKLDPSSETVNSLRKLRENDKLVADLISKNNGVLLDPKEEYQKQFKAGKDAADKVTGPFKRAVSGVMDQLRGLFGMPLAGLSGQRDGQTKYQVDDSISDYEVQRNLAKRAAANIGQNNQLGTALADASGSLSTANESLSKNQSDIAEAKQKIAEFTPSGDADKDKDAMESLQKSLADLEKQTDDLRKAQTKAQNDFNTATQNFQQTGGQTSQIPQLASAKKAEDDKLTALQEAQKKVSEFKSTDDPAKDATSKRELEKAVSDAQTAYNESKSTSARLAAAMATKVTPTLTGPGSPSAGTPNAGSGAAYGLPNGTNINYGAAGFPPWVYALGKQFNVQASTYAGHQEKGEGNQGIDWSGDPADLQRLADYLKANPGLVKQAIYDNPVTGQKTGIAGGKLVGPGTDQPGYYGNDWSGHRDHLHTSQGQEIPTANGAPIAVPPSATPQQVVQSPPPAAGKPAPSLASPRPISEFWDKIAEKESSGNWQNADTGGNGHYGGLQFSPDTWRAFGGAEFAAMPHLATKEQQIEVANRTAFTGWNGTKPQGLGAWEVITNGSTAQDGITVNSKPTLDQIATNTGVTATATAPAQNTLESLLAGNSNLAALMAKAQDPNTSRQETAKLLQDMDDYVKQNPNDADLVNARKQQIMSDRGIKEAEGLDLGPVDKGLEVAGKVQSLVDGVLKVVKWPMDVYNSVQNMFDQGGKAFEMLIRGFSGTKDVNDFVDQMQATWGSVLNVFQTVTGIVGTVADVFSTVADVANTIAEIVKTGAEVAGAIAEVAAVAGAIAGVVSGVVGGVAAAVGSIDEIIDMAQEAWKIGSRYIGKALSWIAGGLGGPMQGTVRALYDANDQTLKFWNAENPDMKTSYGLDPFRKNDAPGSNKPVDDQINRQSTTNIYANPNASAADIMREQQYAVRTAGLGANQNFDD